MNPVSFMLIAGEASGDLLGAELVRALKTAFARAPARFSADAQPLGADLAPVFFGAGGPQMAAAGVELAVDLTRHSVIGLSDALKKYGEFRGFFHRLLALARQRQPEAIIGIDFQYFNGRFAHAVRGLVRQGGGWFGNWNPKLVQYVSPQVWASRPGRARRLAADIDLLLSIIPFEKAWYERRVPWLRVEYVGHPIAERYGRYGDRSPESRVQGPESQRPSLPALHQGPPARSLASGTGAGPRGSGSKRPPLVVLLPGSRRDELRRHLPVVTAAAERIAAARAVRFRMILPDESAVRLARPFVDRLPHGAVQAGDLAESLAQAAVAITKSGTITLECVWFGVPAVVFYKTSWPTYCLGRLAVNTRYLAMPNLLARRPVYPEFIQQAATPANLAQAALELLDDDKQRETVRAALAEVAASLGGPGAGQRAARMVWALLTGPGGIQV